ncbi:MULTISPECIES: iron chelate uptake ABC transporter family permease subunit [unclassified Tessaracoccus]|uniref:iron chelate uptake ABC transporter family permease subunit n=1 Tax=unclassified Tessaracoccus TaxID=2635419 RepID=UPI001602D296|nr:MULTISPECIES: iron chelate uptake ABC transporter family permease subunit [unclassified Tessaracoccus]MBB1511922.1 iron chelate uptake ABC transporter family permease subunit [Tessaracoccus sp. MC1627]MBB1514391.1 iron chelate uptake ABC transporter family permease subunit [Tessaracoccus sp. MC1679]
MTALTTPRTSIAPSFRLLLALALCAVAAVAFMTLNLSGDLGFILELRSRKVASMIVVGWATGVATVAFQTVTNNRLLTPSIMGLDALYVFLQSLLVLTMGVAVVGQIGAYPMFALNVALMLGVATLLTEVLFGRRSRSIYVVVLAGLVLGSVLRSLSSLIARVLDPSAFTVLQDNLFASFTAVNPELIWLGAAIVTAASLWLWRRRADLDVLSLGRDAAVSLGVPYQRTVRGVLLVATLLVCVSTALVGPITFLGLIVAAIAYQISGTGRHSIVMPMAGLLGVGVLLGGQTVLEQLLGQATVLSVVIEFVGGIAFIWLVIRKVRT